MEVGSKPVLPPVYSPLEIDLREGRTIQALKAASTEPIADPDVWLDEELQRGVWTARLDAVLNWGRRYSTWPMMFGLACCAYEMIATMGLRFDFARFGMEIARASPRQADLLIISGTLTWKMAAAVKLIYDQMAEPKWVIAMGSCAISGGPFADSYSVVPGANRILPVDVYIPGCPPRPEGLLKGILMLHEKISHDSIARNR